MLMLTYTRCAKEKDVVGWLVARSPANMAVHLRVRKDTEEKQQEKHRRQNRKGRKAEGITEHHKTQT